jgi:FdhD protein
MTEGVVHDANEIEHIVYTVYHFSDRGDNPRIDAARMARSKRNTVRAELAAHVPVSTANLERNFYTTSSCGICGKASLLSRCKQSALRG